MSSNSGISIKEDRNFPAGEFCYVFNKSIAGFKIFNDSRDITRMKDLIRYYQMKDCPVKYSQLIKKEQVRKRGFSEYFYSNFMDKEKIVQVIAYCIMPTHIHFVLKPLAEDSISIFTNIIFNSYTHYFNAKYKRKGHLLETRTKKFLIETDEQILCLINYVHLNPATANIVKSPKEWAGSSCLEYLAEIKDKEKICDFAGIIGINPNTYREALEDKGVYQRELAKIKSLFWLKLCD
ncbi:MAG: transposase [Candidatus Omnitrophica bacterium]|nr:transposase [Candidatus Omnitrophota bacterium]